MTGAAATDLGRGGEGGRRGSSGTCRSAGIREVRSLVFVLVMFLGRGGGRRGGRGVSGSWREEVQTQQQLGRGASSKQRCFLHAAATATGASLPPPPPPPLSAPLLLLLASCFILLLLLPQNKPGCLSASFLPNSPSTCSSSSLSFSFISTSPLSSSYSSYFIFLLLYSSLSYYPPLCLSTLFI